MKNLFRPPLIHHIINKSDKDNPVELRNVTMNVLSLAGFCRFEDVSRIKSDISFQEGFTVLRYLKARMTSSVKSTKMLSHICLVLHASLSCLRGIQLYSGNPLIPNMLFSSEFLKRRALVSLLPLISHLVALLLEGLFARISSLGPKPSKFGLHSL